MPNADSPPPFDGPVVVAHRRRHHLYHAALGYSDINRLRAFATEMYVQNPAALSLVRSLPIHALRRQVEKLHGYHCKELSDKVEIHDQGFFKRVVLRALGTRSFGGQGLSWETYVARLCIESGSAVHMCCSQALPVFKQLAGARLPLILDQVTGHRRLARAMIEEEYERLGVRRDDRWVQGPYSEKMVAINDEEIDCADVILAGSDFVADTLVAGGCNRDRIVTARYGADISRFYPGFAVRGPGEPLQIAFVGSDFVRKGLVYLLRAAKELGPKAVQVHVFGQCTERVRSILDLRAYGVFHGSLSQIDLAERLRRCHVAVLPSLWEGSALASYECMASGLPSIFTPNTGSIVRDGVNGLIVPIRDSGAIAQGLIRFLDENYRQLIARRARLSAEERSWNQYRSELASGVSSQFGG